MTNNISTSHICPCCGERHELQIRYIKPNTADYLVAISRMLGMKKWADDLQKEAEKKFYERTQTAIVGSKAWLIDVHKRLQVLQSEGKLKVLKMPVIPCPLHGSHVTPSFCERTKCKSLNISGVCDYDEFQRQI